MNAIAGRGYTTVRAYADMARRTKIVAAATGQTMADLLVQIVEPELARMEREHLSRYGSAEQRTRTGQAG